jgi:hypothetical protein
VCVQGEKLEEESASGDVRMAPKAGAYVAPGMRGGAGEKMGDSMRRPRDENSVRVTNLSEDTREHDLNELFRQFGQISRTFIAYDRETGESRGFAFINFINRCVHPTYPLNPSYPVGPSQRPPWCLRCVALSSGCCGNGRRCGCGDAPNNI